MTDVALPTPTAAQLAWQDLELGMFIHYEPVMYAGYTGPNDLPDPKLVNPTKLDTDQWLEAAKAMGARLAVFTAQTTSGFCMWPTETYDYNISQSPWRGGRGDVVGDFVESCHKYGIKPGFYISFM